MPLLNKTPRITRATFGDSGQNAKKSIVSVSFQSSDLGRAKTNSNTVLSPAAGLGTTATTRTTFVAQPDAARNITVTLTGTAASVAATPIVVTGTNAEGKTITDSITPTVGTLGTYSGTKAFKTVTSVAFPAQVATGVTASVGVGLLFGIGYRTVAAASVKLLKRTTAGVETLVNPTSATFSAIALEDNTVQLDVAPTGTTNFRVYAIFYNWHLNPTNGEPVYVV